MFLSRFTEKLMDSMNAFPAFFATAIAKPLYGFENRFRFIADEVVIYVDNQHRGPLSETGTLAVAGKGENLFIPLGQNIIPGRHFLSSFVLWVLESKNIAEITYCECSQTGDED